MEELGSNANPVQFKALDDGGVLGPARQRFDPKHQVVLQCRIPWQAAKVVPEPRIANPELFSKVQSEAPVGKESRS
jgi:hypothetical protein